MRATQHSLEEDIIYKENTLGIDTICHNLTNYSQGINYYGGIEKYDPTVSTIEQWTQATNARINKYISIKKDLIDFTHPQLKRSHVFYLQVSYGTCYIGPNTNLS